ncbi:MAG: hypothetical protein GXP05_03795 [Alphaproteobacteria bacterium]|nr:hypothetical protein [Alphaproteobacteria bacterium]
MFGGKQSLAFATIALFAGCSTVVTTRSLPLEQLPSLAQSSSTLVKSSRSLKWHVQDVRVNVADSLSVSEANRLIPNADIVWRGDPYGDRRVQIEDIIDLAASQAAF